MSEADDVVVQSVIAREGDVELSAVGSIVQGQAEASQPASVASSAAFAAGSNGTSSVLPVRVGAAVQGASVNLLSGGGSIGTSNNPLLLDSTRLSARALRDVALKEMSGSLNVDEVASASGNVFLIAAESIVDARADGLTDVTGNVITLTAGTGSIGTAANQLEIDSSYNGSGHLVAEAQQGVAIVETVGSLAARQVTTAIGNVGLTVLDTGRSDENLLLSSGSMIQTGDGGVLLDVGDNAHLLGLIQATGPVQIVADAANADPGLGAQIDLHGTIRASSVSVRGGADGDRFNVRFDNGDPVPEGGLLVLGGDSSGLTHDVLDVVKPESLLFLDGNVAGRGQVWAGTRFIDAMGSIIPAAENLITFGEIEEVVLNGQSIPIGVAPNSQVSMLLQGGRAAAAAIAVLLPAPAESQAALVPPVAEERNELNQFVGSTVEEDEDSVWIQLAEKVWADLVEAVRSARRFLQVGPDVRDDLEQKPCPDGMENKSHPQARNGVVIEADAADSAFLDELADLHEWGLPCSFATPSRTSQAISVGDAGEDSAKEFAEKRGAEALHCAVAQVAALGGLATLNWMPMRKGASNRRKRP